MKFALILVAVEWAGLVAAQTKYACPGDDGQTITTGGKKYKLMCGSGIQGMPIEESPCNSLAECAERCAKNAQCVHSTLLKTGKCALKKAGPTFQNPDLTTWQFVQDGGGGAQKPTTPVDPSSYTCPADDKKRYTTNDITYELRCNTGHSKGTWKSEPCPSLQECADRCAKDADCYSCDFQRSTSTCAFKKNPAETTAWAEGDAWFPIVCPDVRETQVKKDPEITTSLKCPANNGKIWEGSDGTWFYLQCCTDTDAATVVEQGTAASHQACVEKCVANKKCKSVAYDSANPTDNCRLYGNGGFSTTSADRVHHAYVTLPPTKEAELSKSKLCSTECPDAHGQLYVSVTGENYLMSCNKRHGTTYLKIDRRASYDACLAACSVMPECRSVDYEPRTQRCFYGRNANQPSISADAFVSAHSLGCAGACSSCKKGCDKVNSAPMPADQARCDADHGALLVAGGDTMRLSCRHCWYSAAETIRVNGAVKSLAECAKLCGQDPYCAAANWMGPSGCSMHPKQDKDGKAPTMKRSAQCDSIVPLTRSLAAYNEVDITDSGITERSW